MSLPRAFLKSLVSSNLQKRKVHVSKTNDLHGAVALPYARAAYKYITWKQYNMDAIEHATQGPHITRSNCQRRGGPSNKRVSVRHRQILLS